jgi:hypothetical protein
LPLGVDTQPGHRARHRAFHRAQADAQRRGYFRFGHVLEVPEHDGGPHPLRQPVERAPDDLGHVAFPRVIGYHLIRQFVGRVFVEPAAAPPRYVRVDHRATHVRVERGPVVDLASRPVGLDQGRLEEILGVGPVPGEHDRHPQQGDTPRENIVTERGIVIAGSRFVVLAGAAHADYLT